jgi:putative protease
MIESYRLRVSLVRCKGFLMIDAPHAPELLSPAGDFEAMRAAVANGADAVYFGLPQFNARHRATNFSLEELPEVMAYLHAHNVRGYVTFNTLIFSDELPEAVQFISAIAAAGVDAVIVQDLGIARLINRLCPKLHVHGSTQMTLTEPRGIEFVRSLGVKRVILARELSATDIGKITAATDMPVEIFIHGALCVAYSGQCLTSEALGGRSANRGQCAQACRLPYDLIVDGQMRDLGDKAYLLSPQDLAAYDMIADLTKLGVCSFKIEGRLKSAHYVAATTQTYRAAIDAASSSTRFDLSKERQQQLAQSFSRGFTHGFLDGVNHQELVHARFPKSRGLRVGEVLRTTDHGVLVSLTGELKAGDGVVFDEGHPEQDEQGGRIFAIKPLAASRNKLRSMEITFGRGNVNLNAIAPGAIVWKTDDPTVRRALEQSYGRETIARRVPLNFTVTARLAGALTISASDGLHDSTAAWGGPLVNADRFPASLDILREQLGRLGDSPFELGTVSIVGDLPPVMIPKSVLNDLRRRLVADLITRRESAHPIAEPAALDQIRQEIIADGAIGFHPMRARKGAENPAQENEAVEFRNTPEHGPEAHATIKAPPTTPTLHVLARTLDQLRAAIGWTGPVPRGNVYAEFEDVRKYKEAVREARAAGVPIGLVTTRIIKPGEEGLLRQIVDCQPDAILIRNLAGLTFFKDNAPHIPLIADYAMNIANEITASIMAEHGVIRMVPSYDLNWKQLTAMLDRSRTSQFEVVIHQHMPMFHMEHCVFCHTLSDGKDFRDCGRPCDTHQVDLRDRVSADHPLIADVGCRNTMFNGTAQSAAEFVPEMQHIGLRHFRIELLRDDAGATRMLLDRYAAVLAGVQNARTAFRQLRVINQLGVTRGTLDG